MTLALAADAGTADPTLFVDGPAPHDESPFLVQVDRELILVTGGARRVRGITGIESTGPITGPANYPWQVTRAVNGTSRNTHTAGATVHLVATQVQSGALPATPATGPAANVAVIADPGSATAADAATKVNEVIAALTGAGVMAGE